MEENKKEKKKLLLVIAVFTLLIVASVGGVYAYFAARATNSGAEITGRTLDIDGTKLTIAASRVNLNPTPVPVSDNLVPAKFGVEPTEITTTEVNRALDKKCSNGGYTGCHVWKITASTTQNIPSANIKLNLSLSNVQNKEQWSYVVYTGEDTASSNIINKGYINYDFVSTTNTIDIHKGASLTANTPAIYYVMVYLNNTNSVQNDGVVTGTTNETGTYNGTVTLEAMGGEVYVNFYETDTKLFLYDIVNKGHATYEITDRNACNSYIEENFSAGSSRLLCAVDTETGATIGNPLSDYIVSGEIPSSDYAEAGLSNVNIVVESTEAEIFDYRRKTATYTVIDQSACESYLENAGSGDLSENATTLCTGGVIESGITLGVFIANERIPSSDYAVAGLSNVVITPAPTDVVIPSTIEGYPTSIGGIAFEDRGLTSVVIPSSVTSIGDWAFSDNQLTSVVIPSSVTSIDAYAFFDNPLTSITIGNENATIGNCAFGENPPLSEPFLSRYSCNP